MPTESAHAQQQTQQETSWVLYEPAYGSTSGDSFTLRYAALLDGCGLERHSRRGEEVLVKMDVGEVGAFRTLRPAFIRMLLEKLESLERSTVLFDTCRIASSETELGWSWVDATAVNGYVASVLGRDVGPGDGWAGGEVELLAVEGDEIGGVEVARSVVDGGPLIVLSHVTGHQLSGLSGALANLGEGCLGRTGKRRLRRTLVPTVGTACDGCGRCVAACPVDAISPAPSAAAPAEGDAPVVIDADRCLGCSEHCVYSCPRSALDVDEELKARYARRLVEAAGAVLVASQKRTLFFNFLLDVTAQPDAAGFSDLPVVPDLGVLVSTDPIALDQATIDLLDRAPGVPGTLAHRMDALQPGTPKLGRLSGVDPNAALELAEEYRLGNRSYRLATL